MSCPRGLRPDWRACGCRAVVSRSSRLKEGDPGSRPLRLALVCGTAPDLAYQHLVGSDQRERRPGSNHATRGRRLGDFDIRGQARHAAYHQQRPGQNPAALPLPRSDSRRCCSGYVT